MLPLTVNFRQACEIADCGVNVIYSQLKAGLMQQPQRGKFLLDEVLELKERVKQSRQSNSYKGGIKSRATAGQWRAAKPDSGTYLKALQLTGKRFDD